MPNQRDPKKRLFSVSIDRKVLEKIEEECRKLGISRVEYLRMAALEKLKRDNICHNKSEK